MRGSRIAEEIERDKAYIDKLLAQARKRKENPKEVDPIMKKRMLREELEEPTEKEEKVEKIEEVVEDKPKRGRKRKEE